MIAKVVTGKKDQLQNAAKRPSKLAAKCKERKDTPVDLKKGGSRSLEHGGEKEGKETALLNNAAVTSGKEIWLRSSAIGGDNAGNGKCLDP